MAESSFYYKQWQDSIKEKEDYEEDLNKLNHLAEIASDSQGAFKGVRGSLTGEISETLAKNWSGTKANAHKGNISDLGARSSSIDQSISNLISQINLQIRKCKTAINELEEQIAKWRRLYYEALEEEEAAAAAAAAAASAASSSSSSSSSSGSSSRSTSSSGSSSRSTTSSSRGSVRKTSKLLK